MEMNEAFMNWIDTQVRNQRATDFAKSDRLSLGEVIADLAKFPPEAPVVFDFGPSPDGIDSWRGVYAELALTYGDKPATVAEVLDYCRSAVGQTFTGYKGGDYTMDEDTPVWVANYGDSGVSDYKGRKDYPYVAPLSFVQHDGTVIIITDERDA